MASKSTKKRGKYANVNVTELRARVRRKGGKTTFQTGKRKGKPKTRRALIATLNALSKKNGRRKTTGKRRKKAVKKAKPAIFFKKGKAKHTSGKRKGKPKPPKGVPQNSVWRKGHYRKVKGKGKKYVRGQWVKPGGKKGRKRKR